MKKVILIGFGKFGKAYYEELMKLQAIKLVDIVGVVVRDLNNVPSEFINDLFVELDSFDFSSLAKVDFACIVTPADTHFELIKKVAKYTNVLCEKPICDEPSHVKQLIDLKSESSYIIVPAQTFRYHPIVDRVVSLIRTLESAPISIWGAFTNELTTKSCNTKPSLEFLHFIDLVSYIFKAKPEASFNFQKSEYLEEVSFRLGDICNCKFDLGWSDKNSQRFLAIQYSDFKVTLDFKSNTLTMDNKKGATEKEFFDCEPVSIYGQLISFIDLIDLNDTNCSDLDLSKKVLDACFSPPIHLSKKPKIAVIGAGVFGTNCAIELGGVAEVDLFEKNDLILGEASLFNQWRHHSGFHYPLSYETVKEIEDSKTLFEDYYREAVIYDIPSYYCVSSQAKEIPPERYLSSCNLHRLNYEIVPPPALLAPNSTSLNLLTDEGLYDIDLLRTLISRRLDAVTNVNLRTSTEVTGGQLLDSGRKELSFESNGVVNSKEYDFVINCGYANWHKVNPWFGFAKAPIRLEDVELLELEIDIEPQCITLIDAPFMSLTSMGRGNRFFLSHRDHSLLSRKFENEDGFVHKTNTLSNKDNMINDAIRYLPILKNAKYIKSWRTTKAISAYESEFWARPTIIQNSGFGYWSVLGGKILTSVSNAKEIASAIKNHVSLA